MLKYQTKEDNYTKHFIILVSAITGCISVSAFISLLEIPKEICNRIKSLNSSKN